MKQGVAFLGELVARNGRWAVTDDIHVLVEALPPAHKAYCVDLFKSPPVVFDISNDREVESLDATVRNVLVASAVYGAKASCVEDILTLTGNAEQLHNCAGEHVGLVNSVEVIEAFAVKHYLMELTDSQELPVIPSRLVSSFRELAAYARSHDQLFAKPLAGEESKGAVVLNDLTDEDLKRYWARLELHTHPLGQGVIVQPYMTGFVDYGERKLMMVDGDITLARVHVASDRSKIVAVAHGAGIHRYDPTPEERALAHEAYDWLRHNFGVRYARIDLVSDGAPCINELEVINPAFSINRNIYRDAEVERHMASLISIL